MTRKEYFEYLDSPEFNPRTQFVFDHEPICPTGAWKLIAWLAPRRWEQEKEKRGYEEAIVRGLAWRSKSHEILAKRTRSVVEDKSASIPPEPQTVRSISFNLRRIFYRALLTIEIRRLRSRLVERAGNFFEKHQGN